MRKEAGNPGASGCGSSPDDPKMMLAEAAALEAKTAHGAAVEEFLHPESKLPNVRGLAVGAKWADGQPTGEPALLVLVTHKVAKEYLTSKELVPKKLGTMQTDVLAIGDVIAGGEAAPVAPMTLTRRVRPAMGGFSVGHYKITAGTIATCVYDMLPGASTSPPIHGIGIPAAYYILSNNHVLANCNQASLGDAALQPGPYDGGLNPQDRIGALSRYVPIALDPPVPRAQHANLVDAAIAKINFEDASREIFWIGYARGWRPKAAVSVGTIVKKVGRTTNFTVGRITGISATIDVGYGGAVGRFKDQIVTTCMCAGGDSGSLVLTRDNIAVGLLFAGSSVSTIINQIENVRSLLRVEVAEQVM